MYKHRAVVLAVSLAACAACNRQQENTAAAPAEPSAVTVPETHQAAPATPSPTANAAQPANAQTEQDAVQLIDKAAGTLRKMLAEPKLKQLLSKSDGVFIVPTYVRVGAGVGGRGGEGVLLGHKQGKWSDPVFYDIGGISVGAQFGAEAGEIAMVLMGEQALSAFKGDNQFSLNAGSKLTFADYSVKAQAGIGKGDADVIFWSGTEGAFAGATLSATNLSWDDEENKAYYGKRATAQDVLSGQISDNKQGPLQQALSSL